MAFFILSGFVVAFSADYKHPTFSDYMIARFARLWSVALPAIVLTLVLDEIVRRFFDQSIPSNVRPPFSLLATAASTFFVNQIWFLRLVPGTNLPFWSLSYEFFYYLAFAVAFYFRGVPRALTVVLIAAVAGPKILLLAPIWLLGVVAYRLSKKQILESIGWVLWIGSFSLLIAFYALHVKARLTASLPAEFPLYNGVMETSEIVGNYLFAMIIFANVVGFSIIGHRFSSLLQWSKSWIKGSARYSFSLYLYHFPLIMFFRSLTIGEFGKWWQVLFMYAATLGGSYVLGRLTEPRKDIVAKLLQKLVRVRGINASNDQPKLADLPKV